MRKPLNDKGSLKLSLAAKIVTKGVNIIVILEIFSGLIKDVIKVTLIFFSLGKIIKLRMEMWLRGWLSHQSL